VVQDAVIQVADRRREDPAPVVLVPDPADDRAGPLPLVAPAVCAAGPAAHEAAAPRAPAGVSAEVSRIFRTAGHKTVRMTGRTTNLGKVLTFKVFGFG
jgi:hypothetical protein